MTASAISEKQMNGSDFLDWRDRPPELNYRIQRAFDRLQSDTECKWVLYNGSSGGYGLCGVDEYSLMKTLIEIAPPSQKTFCALDVGAGNFQWGRGSAVIQYPLEKNSLLKYISWN